MPLRLCLDRAPGPREPTRSQRTEMIIVSRHDTVVAHARRTARGLGTSAGVRDQGVALTAILSTAAVAVSGTDATGLTLVGDRYRSALHAAGAVLVGPLDAVQGERDHGPASTVLVDTPQDGTVLVEDFAGPDRDRWPEFAGQAVRAGYRSMLSVLLEVEGRRRGALNLYGAQPHAFDAEARRTAGLLAVTSGILLLAVEQAACLERALASRDLVGRAKGVLMERFRLDEDAAYARLVEASQHTNVKLVEVARWLLRDSGARGDRRLALVDEPCL